MSHSWTHSWCKSPSRDEAVRAAEHGREGPLPTLEEAIAAVTERRLVPPGGCGNVTGLRTERVTLSLARIGELIAERDAAIRERESLREQLESVACRAAAAEMALESSGQADEEDANIGYALRLFVDGSRVLSHELDRQQAGAFLIAAEHLAKYLRTEYQPPVEESAPAASGNSQSILDGSPAASGAAGTGWLTAEEREAVLWLAEFAGQRCGLPWPCGMGGSFPVVAHRLLARSTPPEVVMPECPYDGYTMLTAEYVWCKCVAVFTESLAAAGVTCKEVGK